MTIYFPLTGLCSYSRPGSARLRFKYSATATRMTSERVSSSRWAKLLRAAIKSSGRRAQTRGSVPVAGRPLLRLTDIDAIRNLYNVKGEPEQGWNLARGSNPRHGVTRMSQAECVHTTSRRCFIASAAGAAAGAPVPALASPVPSRSLAAGVSPRLVRLKALFDAAWAEQAALSGSGASRSPAVRAEALLPYCFPEPNSGKQRSRKTNLSA